MNCHFGEPGRMLGVSAVQLSGEREGATLASLAASGALSAPPPAGESYPTPGDATTAAALGYLHANCAHCHNPNGTGYVFNDLDLRLSTTARTPEATGAFRTAVGQPVTVPYDPSLVFRVRPGFPEESAVWGLMARRGGLLQMPPIASELVDPVGLELVAEWIRTLD
jgi:mono/diheme cytochrome c family protein